MAKLLISFFVFFFSTVVFGQNETIENRVAALNSAVDQLNEQEQFYEVKFLDSGDKVFHLKYIVEPRHQIPVKAYLTTNDSTEVLILYTNMFMVYTNETNIGLVQLIKAGKTSSFYFEENKLVFKSNSDEAFDEKDINKKVRLIKKMLNR